MMQKVKGLISRTSESIKGFGSDPINNLGFLIPMAICLTSIISGIVTCVLFIVNGGYSSQVGSIKQNGLDGILEGFTIGTIGMMVSGIVSKIILALVAVELIVMLINYFKNRGKGMRIAMIIDLIAMGIIIALSRVVFWIAVGELVFSEEQLYQALGRFEGVTINLKAVLITYVVVTLVAVICFIVFTLITAECRWMVGYTALALVFANIVMPLFFLILQNIIPLVSGAVAFVVIVVIGILLFKIIPAGDKNDYNSNQPEKKKDNDYNSNQPEKKKDTEYIYTIKGEISTVGGKAPYVRMLTTYATNDTEAKELAKEQLWALAKQDKKVGWGEIVLWDRVTIITRKKR